MILIPEQQARAIEVMNAYLSAPKGPDGVTPEEASKERDRQRVELIEGELLPLVRSYLSGHTLLSAIESASRVSDLYEHHPAWNNLIVPGERKATYRLKLSPKLPPNSP